MRRSGGVFTLIALGCAAFLSLIVWQVGAQRQIVESVKVASNRVSTEDRLRADRESDPGAYTDLSTVPRAYPQAGTIIYAYDTNKRLLSFDASAPGTILTNVELTGLVGDERLMGIDFRPADGLLYGVLDDGFPGPGRLVRIDINTGAVTRVHPTNTFQTPIDTFSGFDFDPVEDRIRQVGTETLNRRINPTNGSLVANDTVLRYAATDVNAAITPRVPQIAYTVSTASSVRTLYGVEIVANTLVRVGGVNGNPSPNGGEITTIGSLGVDPTNFGSMDIPPNSTTAYASLFINAIPTFVSIDLATGTASVIGRIGGDETQVIDGIAIQTGPVVIPSPTPSPIPSLTPIPTPNGTPVPSPTPTPTPPNAAVIRVVNTFGLAGQDLVVGLQLQALGGEKSARFSINFNTSVFTNPIVTLHPTVSAGSVITDMSQVTLGKVGINFDAPTPFAAGTRPILFITFSVSPNVSSGLYPISFSDSPVPFEIRNGNGNIVASWFEQGIVAFGLAAAGVEVSGRVLTPDGRGLRSALVSITGSDGKRRSVTTSSFGHYRFEDVEAGGTYVVSVGSKRYRFTSRVVQVEDTLTNLDLVAN